MAGLIHNLLKGTPLEGVGIMPSFTGNTIKIEINEAQLKELLMRDADPRFKSAVDLRIEQGKIVIEIRL